MFRKIFGRIALTAVAILCFVGVANAQAPAQANASATLTWVQSETLTASISTPALTFTGTTPTTSNFSTTTTWNLGAEETHVYEDFYLGSSTAALSNGSVNIPSSSVFAAQGGPYGACNTTSTQPTAGVVAGAECWNWATVLTGANRNSSHTFATNTLQLQGVSALAAGTYTGVINYSVFAQ